MISFDFELTGRKDDGDSVNDDSNDEGDNIDDDKWSKECKIDRDGWIMEREQQF